MDTKIFIRKVRYKEQEYTMVTIGDYKFDYDDNELTVLFDIENISKPFQMLIEYFNIWHQFNLYQERNVIIKIVGEDVENKYLVIENLKWDLKYVPVLEPEYYVLNFKYSKVNDVSLYFKRSRIINRI